MTQPPPVAVKAVTFDADDTLWNFDVAMRAGLARVLEEIRQLAPTWGDALTVEAMIAERDEAAADLKSSGGSLIAIRREGIRRSLPEDRAADDALVDRLLGIYLEQRDRVLAPFDDVVPVLRQVKGKAVLGVVSNGNSHPDRHGLGEYFDFVLMADDHGIDKPDPRVFQMAAKAAGCTVAEMAHVGDSLETDVAGANRAGAISIWLNRSGRAMKPGDPKPLHVISSLLELPTNLKAPEGSDENGKLQH